MTTAPLTAAYLNEDNGSISTITATVLTVAAGVTLALRLYTKWSLVKKLHWSDAMITFAWFCSVGVTVTFYYALHYGLGRHLAYFEMQGEPGILQLENWLKSLYVSILLYYPTISLAKASILLQYTQVFALSYPRLVIGCWILFGAQILQTITAMLVSAFSCSPASWFWTSLGDYAGRCLDWAAILFFNASWNILTDILLIVIPIWPVRTLRIPRKQKMILGLIFGLGGIGTVMSILRLKSLYDSSYAIGETTRVQVYTAAWSSVEGNVGIMCACLTTLRPLIVRIFPNSFLSTTASSYSNDSPSSPRMHADSLPISELTDLSTKDGMLEEAKDPEMGIRMIIPSGVDENMSQSQRPSLARRETADSILGGDFYQKYVQ